MAADLTFNSLLCYCGGLQFSAICKHLSTSFPHLSSNLICAYRNARRPLEAIYPAQGKLSASMTAPRPLSQGSVLI